MLTINDEYKVDAKNAFSLRAASVDGSSGSQCGCRNLRSRWGGRVGSGGDLPCWEWHPSVSSQQLKSVTFIAPILHIVPGDPRGSSAQQRESICLFPTDTMEKGQKVRQKQPT